MVNIPYFVYMFTLCTTNLKRKTHILYIFLCLSLGLNRKPRLLLWPLIGSGAPLKSLYRFQENFTGSKYSKSVSSVCFSGWLDKRWPSWPLEHIGWDIFELLCNLWAEFNRTWRGKYSTLSIKFVFPGWSLSASPPPPRELLDFCPFNVVLFSRVVL